MAQLARLQQGFHVVAACMLFLFGMVVGDGAGPGGTPSPPDAATAAVAGMVGGGPYVLAERASADKMLHLAMLDLQQTEDVPHPDYPYFYTSSNWKGVTTCRHQMNVSASVSTGYLLIPIHSMWKMVIVNGTAYVKLFWFHDFLSTRSFHSLIAHENWHEKSYALRSPHSGVLYKLPRAYGRYDVEMKTWPLPMTVNIDLYPIDAELGEFEVMVLHSKEYCPLLARKVVIRNPTANPATKSQPRMTFVMTPIFESAKMVVPLLYWSIKWHEKFGISEHVLYFFGRVREVEQDPRAQELIRMGKLKFVLWDSTSGHHIGDFEMHDWFDRYEMQPLMDNHALMAYWPGDTYIITADVDEFLFTRKPMSLPEALNECMSVVRPEDYIHMPAALCVRRTGVWCIDCKHMGLPKCIGSQHIGSCDAHIWMDTDAKLHPLLRYGVAEPDFDQVINAKGFKCLSRIPLTSSLDTHSTKAERLSSTYMTNDTSCFGFFHVVNMYYERLLPPADREEESFRLGPELGWTVWPSDGSWQPHGPAGTAGVVVDVQQQMPDWQERLQQQQEEWLRLQQQQDPVVAAAAAQRAQQGVAVVPQQVHQDPGIVVQQPDNHGDGDAQAEGQNTAAGGAGGGWEVVPTAAAAEG